MKFNRIALLASAAAAMTLVGATAQAGVYDNVYAVTVSEGLTNGSAFDTTNGNPFSAAPFANQAAAAFTYTGKLNFSNTAAQNSGFGDTNSAFGFTNANVTGYSPVSASGNTVVYNGNTVADFGSENSFLNSSASSSSYKWGTYMTFNLGNLAVGTVLTITHDDGVSIYEGNTRVGLASRSADTSAVTDVIVITSNSSFDDILRYSRQNGTPSVLQVSVPEPASMALLGIGLAGVGLIRRRKA